MKRYATMRENVERYLVHCDSLGYNTTNLRYLLRSFAAYASERNPRAVVTTSVAVKWAMGSTAVSPSTQASRLSKVRNFARYCAVYDPRTEIPPSKLLGPAKHRPPAYIYSVTEIRALMKAAHALRPLNGLRGPTYAMLIGLMASTGIRIGEAIRLCLEDIRWDDPALIIRMSKRVKERVVPLHVSTRVALREYVRRRAAYASGPSVSRLFITDWSRPLTGNAVRTVFRQLRAVAGIGGTGKGQPRTHDLRHTFACRRLQQWQKEGVQLDEALMSLSAYLGHAGPANTYWYLTGIPELLDASGERFEQEVLRRGKEGGS